MIRMIFIETDAGPLMGGAPRADVRHRTFDVELPEIEKWLSEPGEDHLLYMTRSFVGIEILPDPPETR